MKTLISIFGLILILGSSGCRNVGRSDNLNSLYLNDWSFIGFKSGDKPLQDPVPAKFSGMNISFLKQGRFKAQSSCNIIYGSFSVSDKNSIKLDSISMTRIFCMDSLEMSWEDKYLTALKHAKDIKINHDTLVLSTDISKDILFLAGPAKSGSGQ